MFLLSIAYAYGWLFAVMSAAMLLPVPFALTFEESNVIGAFVVTSAILAFAGGALIFALKGTKLRTGRRLNLFVLCTIWLIMPLFAALPLYISGQPDGLVAAYFEAVSGFTTTGATVFVDLADVPRSILVWRSILQWLGGFTTLLALGVLIGPLTGQERLGAELRQIGHSKHSIAQDVATAIRTILPVYGGLTLACFALLVFAAIPPFDAFCLALSTLSTGGFMPRSGTIALYGSSAAELILALFMFLGAVSLLWVRAILQFRWGMLREIREPVSIGLIILFLGVLLTVPLLINSPETGVRSVYRSLTLGLATAASFVSTSGFAVSDRTQDAIPYMFVLVICLVGGGRFSTAGGLKYFRVAAMFRQSGRELRFLLFPHLVRPSRYGKESRDISILQTLWSNFVVIVLVLIALTAILSTGGVPLSAGLLAAISSVSNIGPAYSFLPVAEIASAPPFGEMGSSAQLALCGGMMLGRVEGLALLSLMNFAYWRS
ncbi:MAG: TrkH family potassium uptake protein [Methyloligellaceae bacterium]